MIQKLSPNLEDGALNASDDESNPAMANGTWTYAPAQWGGTTMNDPAYTEFADVWKTARVPKGNVEGGDHRPHMAAWACSSRPTPRTRTRPGSSSSSAAGNAQDPAIGKAWVENTGQPARASLLKEYADIRAHFPAIQESLPTAVRYPAMPVSFALYEAVGNDVSAFVLGEKDAETALTDMEASVRQIMQDNGYYDR